MNQSEKQIFHIVSWRLNGSSPQQRSEQAKKIGIAFEEARSQIKGLIRQELGSNVVKDVDAWDLAVVMVFESRAARDAYQVHPSHLAIKALVGPMRKERTQIDFEINA